MNSRKSIRWYDYKNLERGDTIIKDYSIKLDTLDKQFEACVIEYCGGTFRRDNRREIESNGILTFCLQRSRIAAVRAGYAPDNVTVCTTAMWTPQIKSNINPNPVKGSHDFDFCPHYNFQREVACGAGFCLTDYIIQGKVGTEEYELQYRERMNYYGMKSQSENELLQHQLEVGILKRPPQWCPKNSNI